jgi:hypothetical protein
MNSRKYFLSLFAIGLVAALMAGSASAQTRVGEAAVVKNEVLRVAGPSTSQIKVGDGLVRDEVVRTGLDSATRLVMADSTNLVKFGGQWTHRFGSSVEANIIGGWRNPSGRDPASSPP